MTTYRELKIKEAGGLVSVGDPRTASKAPLASPTFTGTVSHSDGSASVARSMQQMITGYAAAARVGKDDIASATFSGNVVTFLTANGWYMSESTVTATRLPGTAVFFNNVYNVVTVGMTYSLVSGGTAYSGTVSAKGAGFLGPPPNYFTYTFTLSGTYPAGAFTGTMYFGTGLGVAEVLTGGPQIATLHESTVVDATLTGTPVAPTALAGTSTNQVATTAFATTADALKANLASPAFTGTPTAPTSAGGWPGTTQVATTAYAHTAANIAANSVAATRAPLASPTFTGTTMVTSPTAAGSNGVRNVTMSTAAPSGGADGDVWMVYA